MMSPTDENKPTGKPGQRNRKAEQRNRKSAQPQSPKPDQSQDAREQIGEQIGEQIEATVASADTSPIGATASIDAAPIDAAAPTDAPAIEAVAPADTPPIGAAPSATTAAVNLRTIANAYGDYTLKSLEEAQSFVDKLTGVRSLNKAVEVQTEFAKQACETFVTESQKISELHKELARQMFKPLQSLVARTTRTER
jgi:Phasin protein